jgi:diguanylate cyclase (GGDEF)-like protein
MSERVVLVAEDSLVVRALLRSQLRERGYVVVEAADGEQALHRARESAPDVVLLDVEMPKVDGFEVLAELKRDPRLADVPVIFITGRTTADDAVRGLDLGAHDYLRKPFEAAELTARVHAAMRTKALQDELRAANEELIRHAGTDPLTGLANRRALEAELRRLCSRSARHGRPLAVALVAVDGDEPDDELVTLGAGRLARRLRQEDVLGRWDHATFALLAPDTDAAGAAALAEALRAVVAEAPFALAGGDRGLTLSLGVAGFAGDRPEVLMARAQAALERARAAGGDRIEADPA